MNFNLVVFRPDGSRRDIPLKPGKYVLGRGADASLRIPLSTVSRMHCEISVEASGAAIRDLKSSNGTYRNNERIESTVLQPGDVLGIGGVQFTVQINGQPARVEPPAPPLDESSLMETPPAGVAASGGRKADPDETVTRSHSVAGKGNNPGDDSSIFDFDFDFEEDDKPTR